MQKGIELARKLLVIKESTTSVSEKSKAEALLNKILKKYRIRLEDIESDAIKDVVFKYNEKFNQLFLQLCFMVIDGDVIGRKISSGKFLVQCTDRQKIEIKELLVHYSDLLKKEERRLFIAFIHKHHLFGETKEYKEEEAPLDTIELERIKKLMHNLEESTYIKALSA